MPFFRLAVIASSAFLMCAAASAQNLVFPSPPQPEAQALVQRFQADFARVSADPAYFTLPASAPAPGCDISKADLYKAAGLAMALPEEAAKISKMTRKQLRDMGMDPEQAAKPTEYSNVNVVALSVPCKNGKVDGEVETIASFDTLTVTHMDRANDAQFRRLNDLDSICGNYASRRYYNDVEFAQYRPSEGQGHTDNQRPQADATER